MIKEFGLWFLPYKIDSKTKFLMPMAIVIETFIHDII
jgi:hypothetical protein